MKFTISDTTKAKQFINIFRYLKDLVETSTLIFSIDGVYMQTMDGSHICLAELKLEADWFDNYEYKSKYDNEMATVHCETLYNVISCYKENCNIIIQYSSDIGKLNITFNGEKTILKEFTLLTLEEEGDLMEIPDAEYTADICMKSAELAELVNELAIFSNCLTFKCDEEWLKMIAKGDQGEMKANISDDDIIQYQIEEGSDIKITYSIEYMKRVCAFNKISNVANIHINSELPLKIVYNFDINNKEEEEDGEGYFDIKMKNFFKFYIAPKLED